MGAKDRIGGGDGLINDIWRFLGPFLRIFLEGFVVLFFIVVYEIVPILLTLKLSNSELELWFLLLFNVLGLILLKLTKGAGINQILSKLKLNAWDDYENRADLQKQNAKPPLKDPNGPPPFFSIWIFVAILACVISLTCFYIAYIEDETINKVLYVIRIMIHLAAFVVFDLRVQGNKKKIDKFALLMVYVAAAETFYNLLERPLGLFVSVYLLG
ncbi:hypothetical protein [Nitrospina gracilis]|uniref:hypothetical protein n=1 Tax=Nitrospina gracilis TaxID=35801 RepID=UPI001F2BDB8B|nr:hypothetical protein [Nitrospina gracilis]MCF8721521.1 hypothetical protein [Nitrospina gracilis Nb-211]